MLDGDKLPYGNSPLYDKLELVDTTAAPALYIVGR